MVGLQLSYIITLEMVGAMGCPGKVTYRVRGMGMLGWMEVAWVLVAVGTHYPTDDVGIGSAGIEGGVGCVGNQKHKDGESGGGMRIRYHANMAAEPGIAPQGGEDQEEPKG